MRAMRLQTQMTPLQMSEVNSQSLGPQQVRIAVSACGRTDLHVVDGELPNPKLPLVPGHEIVGRIKEAGADVIGLNEGDRVGVPWLGWTCGRCEFCLRGQRIFVRKPVSPAIRSTADLPRKQQQIYVTFFPSPCPIPMNRQPPCFVRA